METYYTDNQKYDGATVALLKGIEPAIGDFEGRLDIGTPSASGYEIKVTSKGSSANVFTIKNTSGAVSRTCTTKNTGGCPSTGSW